MMVVKSLFGIAAVISVLSVAVPAAATTFTVDGDTTSGDTYRRPLADFVAPTQLSLVGTAVPFVSLSFTVSAPGSYDFLMTSTTAGYDPVLTLYRPSFDPANSLTNALITNDDLMGDTTISGFTRLLLASASYVVVMTGFSNEDFGTFTLTIDGPGTVTADADAVPEPSTWALFIGGFGLIGAAMRRRPRIAIRFA